MIHTIIDLSEVLFDNTTADISFERTKNGYCEYITVNGQKKLHRMFSTSQRDYLSVI